MKNAMHFTLVGRSTHLYFVSDIVQLKTARNIPVDLLISGLLLQICQFSTTPSRVKMHRPFFLIYSDCTYCSGERVGYLRVEADKRG